MPNYRQAPKLYHDKSNYNSECYYNLPQELMDCVFTQLDGKCGNQIKLMVVLLGTLGNGTFGVSEKWVCERTGMVQQTYNTARKALVERGWIYLEDGMMFVLPKIIKYGFHYPEGATKEEMAAIREGTISNCVNDIKKANGLMTKAHYEIVPQAQYEIVYNKINNKVMGRLGLLSPDGANNPNPELTNDSQEVKISGEIDEITADSILDKQMLSNTLLYIPSSGKYFRIRR